MRAVYRREGTKDKLATRYRANPTRLHRDFIHSNNESKPKARPIPISPFTLGSVLDCVRDVHPCPGPAARMPTLTIPGHQALSEDHVYFQRYPRVWIGQSFQS